MNAFLKEDFSTARKHAYSLASMLCNEPNENEKDIFWTDVSTNFCTALILGLCEKHKDEPQSIYEHTIAFKLTELPFENASSLDAFFNQFQENHPARVQYNNIFSSERLKESVLVMTQGKINKFYK
ncbi:MAG: hypothetical protein ACI35O_16520 [Bacillaceae bacterium]